MADWLRVEKELIVKAAVLRFMDMTESEQIGAIIELMKTQRRIRSGALNRHGNAPIKIDSTKNLTQTY